MTKISDVARVAYRQLTLLQTKLDSINVAIRDLDDAEDDAACSHERYRDQATQRSLHCSSPIFILMALSCKVKPELTRRQLTVNSRSGNVFVH